MAVLAAGLIFVCAAACSAASSANISIGDYAYNDLERLEVKGLLKSQFLSTKPFGRLEALRLLKEASEGLDALDAGKRAEAQGIITRLKERLEGKGAEGNGFYARPVGGFYTRLVYAEERPYFLNVNNNGDVFEKGLNIRAGFSSEAGFPDFLTFYLNPEYRLDQGSSQARLVRGYLLFDIKGLELLLGRDSMWWGPSEHGSLLISDNAKPFDMIKISSSSPFKLPWVLERIGDIKPTVFLTRLEEDRDFARANLLGMRLDFKPAESFGFGLSRVFMFGGEGRGSLSFPDWVKVFFAADDSEHKKSPINGNQLASIDAYYVYVNRSGYIPFSGIKLYTEWGAEDSSGRTKTPSNRANIYGALIDEPLWAENFDMRVEWANTARHQAYTLKWYTHGIYKTGYTYEGRLIGHHMGGDSQDLFIRVQRRLDNGAKLGIEADREWTDMHLSTRGKKTWLGLDATVPYKNGIILEGGFGLEDIEDPMSSAENNGVSVWARSSWEF